MNDPEEWLVSQSRQYNRAAFEELVRRTGRLVFSRIYLDVGDVHLAEDLAQETFLTAWRSIGQVTDAGGFRSWLLTIARTVAIDARRRGSRQKRTGRRMPFQALDDLSDRRGTPEESAEREEERQRVLSVLRSLPIDYQLPLTLRYIAGADYDAIGRQLGLTNGALRGLLHRGMRLLREKMKAGEP